MNYHVYSQSRLIPQKSDPLRHDVLLNEGGGETGIPAWITSLDELIDGDYAWLEAEAEAIVDLLGERPVVGDEDRRSIVARITPAYLNARTLRAYVVKLLKPIVYFTEVQPLRPGEEIVLHVQADRDETLVDLFTELTQTFEATLRVERHENEKSPEKTTAPHSKRLRRWAGKMASVVEPRFLNCPNGRRVLLCGDVRMLDPVCAELLDRGTRLWWLNDEFSPKTWLKWRHAGVGQLNCNSRLGRRNRLAGSLPDCLAFREVNLTPALSRQLVQKMQRHGRRQTRMVEQIARHFRRIRPDAIVLSENRSPFARAVIAVARRYRAKSFVLQNQAPIGRFDFAPLTADRLLAWGASSVEQLIEWGIPASRIEATGSPRHDPVLSRWKRDLETVIYQRVSNTDSATTQALESLLNNSLEENRSKKTIARSSDRLKSGKKSHKQLLVLAAPSGENGREEIANSLSQTAYARMLKSAFEALAKNRSIRVTVKLSGASRHDLILEKALSESALSAKVIRREGSLEKRCAEAEGVLSFSYHDGIEATLYGTPVIQVLTSTADKEAARQRWGFAATVDTESTLETALDRLFKQTAAPSLAAPSLAGPIMNFGGWEETAASRVADLILDVRPDQTGEDVQESTITQTVA